MKRIRLSYECLEDRSCPTTYTTVDLVPLPGHNFSYGLGLNDHGVAVGRSDYLGDSAPSLGVVWQVNAAGKVAVAALPGIAGNQSSNAGEINNVGIIAGASRVSVAGNNYEHAAVWTGAFGSYAAHDLGTLGGVYVWSHAFSISEADANGNFWVAGYSTNSASDPNLKLHHAALWRVNAQGNVVSVTDLEPALAPGQYVWANDVKVIGNTVFAAGSADDAHAIVWEVNLSGTVVGRNVLSTASYEAISANALNNDGDVAGWGRQPGLYRHGFLHENENDVITDLGSLGTQSEAHGINDENVIVGEYNIVRADRTETHAFVWENGTMHRLLDQVSSKNFWLLFGAHDVNATGTIVGHGRAGTRKVSQEHGFMARPSALLADSVGASVNSMEPSIEQVAPLFTEAMNRWQRAGADVSALSNLDVRIADLGGTTLGLASGQTIWLDDNAAGWGWFVDPTPSDDSEFTTPGNQGEQNRMDLLTVLMHEIGHVLGHEHDEGGVMAETLSAGTRLTLHGVDVQEAWWLAGLPDDVRKRGAFGTQALPSWWLA